MRGDVAPRLWLSQGPCYRFARDDFGAQASLGDYSSHPAGEHIEHFLLYLGVAPTASSRDMESMVGVLQPVQRSALAQPRNDRLQQLQLRERISGPLNEYHRDADVVQMRGALGAGAVSSMQRKSEEHQSANPWQGSLSLRLRGHPSTEGASAGEERQVRCESRRCSDGRTHRCVTQGGRVGTPVTVLHVRKLVTQRRDAPLRKSSGRTL